MIRCHQIDSGNRHQNTNNMLDFIFLFEKDYTNNNCRHRRERNPRNIIY
jgi:hypothetical protein